MMLENIKTSDYILRERYNMGEISTLCPRLRWCIRNIYLNNLERAKTILIHIGLSSTLLPKAIAATYYIINWFSTKA